MATVRKMTAAERRERIMLVVAQSGFAANAALADHLGVSEMTVRRDLDSLEAVGKLRRSFGGAVQCGARMDLVEPALADRLTRNAEAKARIAAAAAAAVTDGEFVALDIGSTALAVAHALRDRDVRILTPSLKIAALLADARPQVIVPGGEVRGAEPSVTGAMARRQIEGFRFDRVLLGLSGLGAGGLFDYSLDDAEIKRALIDRAGRVVALADASKFDRMSVALVGGLDVIDEVVTDAAPPEALAAALAAAGVAVTLATRDEGTS